MDEQQMMEMFARVMAGRDSGWGDPRTQQQAELYSQLGPEGLREITDLGSVDDRRALAAQQNMGQLGMLQEQMQQAQQFSQPVGKDYGSVAGNIGGGIGDILRQVGGGIRSRQVGEQQQALMKEGAAQQQGLLDQQDKGRFAAQDGGYRALVSAMAKRGQPQQPPMAQQQQRPGFGLPGLQFNPFGA